ncbi:cupin domain-containing protein [soil metagenome]
MRQYLLLATVLSFLLVPFTVQAQEPAVGIVDEGPERHLIYQPAEIEWRDGPGSFAPGAQFAILEGDPSQPGLFTMRIRMPDGFVIAPHWHPGVERLTVISGTFRLGHGNVLDRAATQPLGAGSYFSLPPESRHYAITEGETEIQLSSIGPWEINYVNPADDPRRRE